MARGSRTIKTINILINLKKAISKDEREAAGSITSGAGHTCPLELFITSKFIIIIYVSQTWM